MPTAAWLEDHPQLLAYPCRAIYEQVRQFSASHKMSRSKAVELLLKRGLGLAGDEAYQPAENPPVQTIQALEKRIEALEQLLGRAGSAVENAPHRSTQDSSFQPESDRNPEPPFEPPASCLVGNVGEITLAVDDQLAQGKEEQGWELLFEEDEIKDLEMLPSPLNVTLDRTDADPIDLPLRTSSLYLPAARTEQSSLDSTDIPTDEASFELCQNLQESEQEQDNQGTIKNSKEVPNFAETRPLEKPKKGNFLIRKIFGG